MSETIVNVRKPKVWKIGSRWSHDGSPDTSLFSLFLKNGIVFVGEKGPLLMESVIKGDYIAIADGITIKAVAQVLAPPCCLAKLIDKDNFQITDKEKLFFNYDRCKDYAIGCKVLIKKLGNKSFDYLRGAFFSANKYQKKIIKLFNETTELYTLKNENLKYDKLNILFTEWKQSLTGLELEKGYTENDFIEDGFYPFYTEQKYKILFIGREALGLKGKNSYITEILKAYKNNRVGEKNINKYQFHSVMFHIAYGLCKECYEYKKIPKPNKLTKYFGTPDGISFAFMNISKFANRIKWQRDLNLIKCFTDNSKIGNFIHREIEILDPDIIIVMNFNKEQLDLLGERTKDNNNSSTNIDSYKVSINNRLVPLLDTWHFSAPGKSPERDIFNPLVKTLKDINFIL